MDNLTHAALGICCGLAARRANAPVAPAALAALLAAEAPDLDILIRSANDPLVAFRWHRHFSHSFVFLPIIVLLSALLAAWFFKGKHVTSTKALLIPAAAGGLSHILCDACTSFGTMLLWPFSNERIAWDCVAVVDLAVTLPLVVLAWRAWKSHRHVLAWLGVGWFAFYATLGRIQHNRAEAALLQWVGNQSVTRFTAKPTISNLILWRGIWLENGVWHIAALRISPFSATQVLEGESRVAWTPETPGTPLAGTHAGSILTDFSEFTGGWNSVESSTSESLTVGDIRFAMLADRAKSLWAVRLPDNDQNPELVRAELEPGDWSHFAELLSGSASGYKTLP